jgi:hypothetical protein
MLCKATYYQQSLSRHKIRYCWLDRTDIQCRSLVQKLPKNINSTRQTYNWLVYYGILEMLRSDLERPINEAGKCKKSKINFLLVETMQYRKLPNQISHFMSTVWYD